MRQFITLLAIFICTLTSIMCGAEEPTLFRTSVCYDLLASVQNFDNLQHKPQFAPLAADSAFMRDLDYVNSNTRASKLCNAYSMWGYDKGDVGSCIRFVSEMPGNIPPEYQSQAWMQAIINVRPQLLHILNKIADSGYADYWSKDVYPRLNDKIRSYYSHIPPGLLDRIHEELAAFALPEIFNDAHTNIFVLDIDNAFNLMDETFCCTYLLLDPELEKVYHLDFMKVYVHENLHRLRISEDLMKRLDSLLDDDFYRAHEQKAASHNEGRNEAVVVAAEVYISHKLGRRDDRSVLEEFKEYVDGSLVLAPIIYVNLDRRMPAESYNDFIIRLMDDGTIKAGDVERAYRAAMDLLEKRAG